MLRPLLLLVKPRIKPHAPAPADKALLPCPPPTATSHARLRTDAPIHDLSPAASHRLASHQASPDAHSRLSPSCSSPKYAGRERPRCPAASPATPAPDSHQSPSARPAMQG